MKVLVLSDLHLERGLPIDIPPGLQFDITVMPGDIHSPGQKAVAWAQGAPVVGERPSVLVPGNHELYGARDLDAERLWMLRAATEGCVHVLDRRSVVIYGVRFLGCMLWTDFQLPIVVNGKRDTNVGVALRAANMQMADYHEIQVLAPAVRAGRHREIARRLQAEDTLAMHWVDRDWLRRELRKPFDGPTIVVTHHAPSAASVSPEHDGDLLSPAYASDLPDEFFGVPSLWIHGHTHSSADYLRGGCRIVSNPRGDRLNNGSFENAAFLPGLVVEVGQRRPGQMALQQSAL